MERKRARGRGLHEVRLDPREKEVLETLEKVVNRFELRTTVRIAGGWVRDKLLGNASHDIDVALDDMTGEAFAKLVNSFLVENGKETHRIGLIQANPDQSKHLETAAVTVLGLTIDFVNLRNEEYHVQSRIPQVEFGTPLQDAERRDFTINSLFYNINRREVEDFTGLGIRDLERGVIRTPLSPRKTFSDDPLRMLRAVRFAARFDFAVEDEVQDALRHPETQQALSNKISRERVGAELWAMLGGQNPLRALELLADFGLSGPVFSMPSYPAPANPSDAKKRQPSHGTEEPPDTAACEAALAAVDWRERAKTARAVRDALEADAFQSKTAAPDVALCLPLVAATLHGLHALKGGNYRSRPEPLVVLVLRDALKLRGTFANSVQAVVEAAAALVPTARLLAEGSDSKRREAQLLTGRQMFELRELYHVALCLAATVEPDARPHLEALFEQINGAWGLARFWEDEQPMNGKEMIKELGLKRGGPFIGALMELQRDWMILNRGKVDAAARRAECKAFLLANKERVLREDKEREREASAARARAAALRKKERADRRLEAAAAEAEAAEAAGGAQASNLDKEQEPETK